MAIILGIETSCDETGIAIYHSKYGIRASALYSQIDLQKQFGGVVPEIASRSQLEKIGPVIHEALQRAQINLSDINAIAVTYKPGLPGSLLVGVCFAKALAYALSKPIIGVNHLEGHIYSIFLEHTVPFPHICITASGGHTALYRVDNFGSYALLGQTLDDAAGEAFDKVAKLLNLPYPGGPEIEKLAYSINFTDFFKYPRALSTSIDFSFSGLKTAVLYSLINHNAYNMTTKQLTTNNQMLKAQVASSLLVCITDIFKQKLTKAHELYPNIQAVTFVGGVACNMYIRSRLQEWAHNRNLYFFTPSPRYCTDNGAMIAFVGNYKAQQGNYSTLSLDIYD